MPRFSNKIVKKRKFFGNRFVKPTLRPSLIEDPPSSSSSESEVDEPRPRPSVDRTSASFSKLNNRPESFVYSEDRPKLDQTGYRLIDLVILNKVFNSCCVCPKCRCKSLSLSENLEGRRGWASNLSIICTKCQFSHSFYTSEKVDSNEKFECNVRLCYAMRSIGKAHKASELFSTIMNMPPPPATFQKYIPELHQATQSVCDTSMKHAGKIEKSLSENNRDTSVTVDGTWMRRGHTSLYGVVVVNSLENGKVLDMHTCSKYCHSCELSRNLPKDSTKYINWESSHKPECKINYQGSSGGMEVDAAVKIFSRSEEKHGLRYTKYIGDGDSKGYNAVVAANVYGDDCPIEKHECIGHIQKRMGGRLRKLRKEFKKVKLSDGHSLSGRNRLTDKQIDSLQFYYGEAIRRNTDSLQNMKQAVWATFLHKASTDEKPQHFFCPKGADSWCQFNKGLDAEGNNKDYKHKNGLPAAVIETIKPVFKDLANPDLLRRCLHGKTQNNNEALNQLIWDRCPKVKFCSKEVVEICAFEAISFYNDGYVAVKEVLEKLGVKAGSWCEEGLEKLDVLRITASDRKTLTATKTKRKQNRAMKKQKVDKEKEGGNAQYGYGLF